MTASTPPVVCSTFTTIDDGKIQRAIAVADRIRASQRLPAAAEVRAVLLQHSSRDFAVTVQAPAGEPYTLIIASAAPYPLHKGGEWIGELSVTPSDPPMAVAHAFLDVLARLGVSTQAHGTGLDAIDTVIARTTSAWPPVYVRCAVLYANAVLDGTVTGRLTDDRPETVAPALGLAVSGEETVDGRHLSYTYSAWETGIRSVHALARGVVESCDHPERYHPDELELLGIWAIRDVDLDDLDATLEDLASAFRGDVGAAAAAIVRAPNRPRKGGG